MLSEIFPELSRVNWIDILTLYILLQMFVYNLMPVGMIKPTLELQSRERERGQQSEEFWVLECLCNGKAWLFSFEKHMCIVKTFTTARIWSIIIALKDTMAKWNRICYFCYGDPFALTTFNLNNNWIWNWGCFEKDFKNE